MSSETAKAGYKNTEVGVIPEDWVVDCIRNLASITTGAKNTEDKIEDGEFPFFVRSASVEKINSYSFDGEAVLTAGDGVGTGKIFHYINGKFDFHQRVYKISNFRSALIGYFFYLYFSNYFYDRIMSMTAKSSVDSVRMEMIADMKIPIPPLPEQTAIAATLSDADALITSLNRLIAKKRNIKQAAMQELLTGKKRLPEFDNCKDFKQTDVGFIPEDWDIKNLGSFTTIFVGGDLRVNNFSTFQDDKYKYPIFSNTVDNEGLYGYYDILEYEGESLTVIGRGVGVGTAFKRYGGYGAIGRLIVLFPKKNVDPKYLVDQINYSIKICEESTGIPQLTGISLAKYKLPIPHFPEQTAIATVLSDMDTDIAKLEEKRDKARMIKEGMMQELLTGRIRLV